MSLLYSTDEKNQFSTHLLRDPNWSSIFTILKGNKTKTNNFQLPFISNKFFKILIIIQENVCPFFQFEFRKFDQKPKSYTEVSMGIKDTLNLAKSSVWRSNRTLFPNNFMFRVISKYEFKASHMRKECRCCVTVWYQIYPVEAFPVALCSRRSKFLYNLFY